VAHWTIVLNLLWQFWRRSQPTLVDEHSGEKMKSKSESEEKSASSEQPNKSKNGQIKPILDDKKSLEGLPLLQRILINLNQLKKVLINQNQL